ncbi:PREDICTED: equilibrative nucleoside transporter 1 [Ceratosolen solmsi marchali]|uniref:Equilibrative nucleoside transporter 1 n=1 Tax=Ceratosolen solmsi marchali TaxID=326594 RepID=A0AAJ6YRA7_9HYME|nr:PREDICTED: equilibrative nucleoside transporter 1 [Ceratosolen solmsi marchali]
MTSYTNAPPRPLQLIGNGNGGINSPHQLHHTPTPSLRPLQLIGSGNGGINSPHQLHHTPTPPPRPLQRIEPLLKIEQENDSETAIHTEPDDLDIVHSIEESFIRNEIPCDRYNIAYIIFYLLGISTLIPWNFFITADDYWMYKFREIKSNKSQCIDFNGIENSNKTNLQTRFTSYISISSAISNTLFLIINTFISKKISLSTRMIGSQLIIIIIFIVTSSFVRINTDKYQNIFFIITLISVVLVNAASAVFSGSLLGIIGQFSAKYITAMSAGQALGGIFTALTEILSLWIGAIPEVSGLLYFIIGDIILLISLIVYIILEKAAFFKYHVSIKIEHLSSLEVNIDDEISFSCEQISYSQILKKIWQYGFSLFLIFFITMTVYPSITVLIESERKGYGHVWNDIYFVPVVTYLIFSCGDYIGRILSGVFIWPRNKPWLVILLSISRGVFVPAFLYCNAQPRRYLPVYIHDDGFYILLMILFALSNGYLCNIVFMLIPLIVNSKEKEIASAMLGSFLGIGLSIGSSISLLMIKSL